MSDTDVTFLRRPKPPRALISLVPMIDVMLILLVFFMVTSTYLNLDMIPAVQRTDDPAAPASQQASGGSATLLIRLGADGVPTLRGQRLSAEALSEQLGQFAQEAPNGRILVLPSGAADMQALITVMDAATQAGARDLRVVRLEALP